MPQLQRHGPTVYNGNLRGSVTLTPVAEHLTLDLSLPVFTTSVCRDRGSKPDIRHARRTLYIYPTAVILVVAFNTIRCAKPNV